MSQKPDFSVSLLLNMAYAWVVFVLLWSATDADDIELLECEPPDIPRFGGYGPQLESYVPGDFIHYFCETDTFIGGNYYRLCEDTGDWSGHTPVCDVPSSFSTYTQTSTLNEDSFAENAVDGLRTSCTSTVAGSKGEWSGTFTEPGQLIRVMLFFPKGPVSFEVVLVKTNGEEIVCGSQTKQIDRLEWTFQNCPEPHNTGAAGLKIKSLNNEPLKICEIQAFVLTSPKCVDPRFRIESGRLRLDRKSAVLMCHNGYMRSPDDKLKCIREGVWDRKNLFCYEPTWEPNSSSDNKERDN